MEQNTDLESEVYNENSQILLRKEKLSQISKKYNGISHPNRFRRNIVAKCLHSRYKSMDKASLEEIEDKPVYKIAGRIVLRRIMGKASFITIQDMSGRIQVYFKSAELPDGLYDEFKNLWDLGDIVGIEGYIFKTKTGELSLHATHIKLLTKALRPLPDKFHGLLDQESRYRQRYVDLITNEKCREVFRVRADLISYSRNFFTEKKFMEVETPMMHTIPGGATARPFETYHNTLDMPLYLRVAPELYLKRLVVGGFERVFEINRNFRNEGVSSRHNPEFTMLEFYQAYSDYNDLMTITEDLISGAAQKIHGSLQIPYQGQNIDYTAPYERLSMVDSIIKYNDDIKSSDLSSLSAALEIAKKLNIKILKEYGLGRVITEIFESTTEEKLIQPVFITEYPAEVSPLARRNDENPDFTDRFEFFIGGREIANGFSELNDAADQSERFDAQVKANKAGDDEAMLKDSDYITALEYGMPPTAGEGIGIDRLAMYFTDSASIRDVILFPHMRNKQS